VTPEITPQERDHIARRNRALLEVELRNKRLVFESRPYEAHVQFSTFCNMSCIMCWDGGNPPTEKMSPVVLEKVGSQIATDLSVITPYEGSEPLILSWEETREMAERYSVQLALTTNMQFLDEQKFYELKDIVEMVVMSIDSHLPEVFEKIRPGSKRDLVFANVPRAARLCEEHGIECIAQAVFMTENAAQMPETVEYFADAGIRAVNIIQMIDVNKRSRYLDPTLHFSAEWIEWIKQRCLAVAKRRKLRFGWWVEARPQWWDFCDEDRKVPIKPHKAWNDPADGHAKLLAPGFCKYAYNRLRITVNGDVSPCGMATEGELHLGNLREQDFPEIWNGPTARDLRRAHFTWDYPALCASCRMVALAPPKSDLPFIDRVIADLGQDGGPVAATLVAEHPSHMSRQSEPPVIRVHRPEADVARWIVALALAGDSDDVAVCEVDPVDRGPDGFDLPIDRELWEGLASNLGYWWSVFALSEGQAQPCLRSEEIRCIVRHEHMPRVPGSTLGYADNGHAPAIYLGGERQVGWTDRATLPVRPRLGGAPEGIQHAGEAVSDGAPKARRRDPQQPSVVTPKTYAKLVGRVRTASQNVNGKRPPRDYPALVRRVREVAQRSLPGDATVLVASKGDGALLDLGSCEGWHFPCGEDGAYVGHHPPDDAWAVENLESACRLGAGYLLLPDTSRWWLDHYPGFAEHLRSRYTEISPEPDACLIFDLGS